MNGGHLIGVQNRRFGKQPSTLLVGRFQQVTFGADISCHRHHNFFTNRIDRWVGDLGKQLAKVIVQQPWLVTQTSQRCIVTHRQDRVFFNLQQRQQHELHRLVGITKGPQPRDTISFAVIIRLLNSRQAIESNAVIFEPLLVRITAGDSFF